MRKLILSATLAAIAALSFAAPSQAGGYGHGYGWGHHAPSYGGHTYVYDDYGYEPVCRFKKVKRWDRWGNLYFKTIKICR
ncbi:hypothetical protein [Ensifer soli]|uniref:hypothetical protein n=1 Tax=Ciceribacter sp. sgz301302 TaxID=3342379 RepID=UPI0035BA21D7